MAPTELAARPAPHVRIPKLAYRNRLPADQASLSSQNTSGSETRSNEALTDLRLLTPSTTSTSSPVRPSFDSPSLTSPSLASNASSSKDGKAPKKKKPNAVLGFLSLKEPSQSALEQFAEQQRKQGKQPADKSTAGLPGVSTQKLPATVPKVNSKWDGIPTTAKAKDSASKNRMSVISTSTRGTSRFSSIPSPSLFSITSEGSYNPPNTIASAASSVSDFSTNTLHTGGERRDSGPSGVEKETSNKHMRSPSTTTLPEISCFFPDNSDFKPTTEENPSPNNSSTKAQQKHEPVGAVSSSAANISHNSWRPVSIASPGPSSGPSLQSMSSERSYATLSSTANGSDLTPNALDESTIIALTSPPSPASLRNPMDEAQSIIVHKRSIHGFLAGEAKEVQLPEDDDEDDELVSDSHDFLFDIQQPPVIAAPVSSPAIPSPIHHSPARPQTMNFSRPLSHQPASPALDYVKPSPPAVHYKPNHHSLPTLYEASVASSNGTNDTIADLPDIGRSRKNSDALSITPSVTPSEMSATWYQTSRERLGLGGRIRKNDVLPWESSGGVQSGKRKKNPLSMFGRSAD